MVAEPTEAASSSTTIGLASVPGPGDRFFIEVMYWRRRGKILILIDLLRERKREEEERKLKIYTLQRERSPDLQHYGRTEYFP
jgi:hypothetical protein